MHLDALELKVKMSLDHHSYKVLLQVLQKIHVDLPASAVPRTRPLSRTPVQTAGLRSAAASPGRVRARIILRRFED